MQKPAKQALTFWLIAAVLILLVLVSVLGAPRTPDGAGEAVGRVFAQTGLAALLAWWLARRRNPPWSWLQFGSVYVIAVVALGLLAAMGRAHADEALPPTVAFAQDRTVERLADVLRAVGPGGGLWQRARRNGGRCGGDSLQPRRAVAWKIILTPFSVVPSASWRSPGFAQGPHHPVVCITWQDARGYAEWLASRTDHPYRLLYEAE